MRRVVTHGWLVRSALNCRLTRSAGQAAAGTGFVAPEACRHSARIGLAGLVLVIGRRSNRQLGADLSFAWSLSYPLKWEEPPGKSGRLNALLALITSLFAIVMGSAIAVPLLALRLELPVEAPLGLGVLVALSVSGLCLYLGARYLLRRLRLNPAMLLRSGG